MIRKHIVKLTAVTASVLMAFALTQNVWAECTHVAPAPKTVGNVKGVVGCADMNNRFGCTVNNGTGSCTAYDALGAPLFTATSSTNATGQVSWNVAGAAKVDEVFVWGTTGGNTCIYAYADEAISGSGLGFLKSNNSYQNVQGVDFCTDGSLPPPPQTIPRCEDFLGIDGVSINCPANGARSIVFNFELGQPFYNTNGSPLACVCNNNAPLNECDPNVPAGQPNACPNPTTKTGVEVTTNIELNNDPYVCQTIGGRRTCFSY
jgi:hypothetical protein